MDARQAVVKAGEFVGELYPAAQDIRLEEVALDVYKPRWNVVVSFKLGEPSPLAMIAGQTSRLFKTVEVDNETGTAEALRVWKP